MTIPARAICPRVILARPLACSRVDNCWITGLTSGLNSVELYSLLIITLEEIEVVAVVVGAVTSDETNEDMSTSGISGVCNDYQIEPYSFCFEKYCQFAVLFTF